MHIHRAATFACRMIKLTLLHMQKMYFHAHTIQLPQFVDYLQVC